MWDQFGEIKEMKILIKVAEDEKILTYLKWKWGKNLKKFGKY